VLPPCLFGVLATAAQDLFVEEGLLLYFFEGLGEGGVILSVDDFEEEGAAVLEWVVFDVPVVNQDELGRGASTL
jgi:hypothetical protein